MPGYLEITFGPMFSGKTTNLIEKINKYIDITTSKGIEKSGLVINSIKDDREGETSGCLTTHSSVKREASDKITYVKVKNLHEVDKNLIQDSDYIAIDESQFFTDLVEFVKEWIKLGKIIHCSGLIADVNRKLFGDLIYLFPFADEVTQLKAFCIECESHLMNAPFTKLRKSTGKDGVIFVSGSEHYVPVCGKHF